MVKPSKPKAAEPSLRDKLSKNFLEALEADFREYGKDVIEQMRTKDPTRYAELAGKMIMTAEPRNESIENSRNMHEVAIALLKSVGFNSPDDNSIEQAIKANDAFINRLQAIYQCAMASETEIH
jgi:tRNA G37 N-methylase TrmD